MMPEVEHKQMHSDQRHDQPVLLAQGYDDRGKQVPDTTI